MASLRVAVKASKQLEAAEGDKADQPTQDANGSAKGHSVAAFYADDVPKGMPQSPGTRLSSFARIPAHHNACGGADGEAHSLCTFKDHIDQLFPAGWKVYAVPEDPKAGPKVYYVNVSNACAHLLASSSSSSCCSDLC
jgi:hypothetical protein